MQNNNVLCLSSRSDLDYLSEEEKSNYLKLINKKDDLNTGEKDLLKKLKRKITNKKHYVKRSTALNLSEHSENIEKNEDSASISSQLAKIMDDLDSLKTAKSLQDDKKDRGNAAEDEFLGGSMTTDLGGILDLLKWLSPLFMPASIMVILIFGQIPVYQSLGFGFKMSVLISITTQFATIGLWFLSEQGDFRKLKDLKVVAVLFSAYVVTVNGANVFESESKDERRTTWA